MNYSETVAAHVVEQAFPRIRAELHDTGSAPGQYDFDLVSDGQPVGAMEVTSDVVEFSAHFRAVLERKNYRLATTAVGLGWLLFVRSRNVTKAWLTKLESQCDGLLAELEVADVTRFLFSTDYDTPAVKLLGELGVEHGAVIGSTKPEIILTEFNTDPWVVSPQHALDACARAAAQPDNISKLASAQWKERHLFVWIDTATSHAAWSSLNDSTPAGVLSLPAEITHIWAAASTRDNEIICWLWDRAQWRVFGPYSSPQ